MYVTAELVDHTNTTGGKLRNNKETHPSIYHHTSYVTAELVDHTSTTGGKLRTNKETHLYTTTYNI